MVVVVFDLGEDLKRAREVGNLEKGPDLIEP
jgi:hypothetical protein